MWRVGINNLNQVRNFVKTLFDGHSAIKCGKLSVYSAFNADVIGTLFGNFPFSLPEHLYFFPQSLVFWPKWLV